MSLSKQRSNAHLGGTPKFQSIFEEEEVGQKELSLGKYSFDVHRQKWKAHPSANEDFPNAIKECERSGFFPQSHFAEHRKNMLTDNLIELKFKFKFDKRKVMAAMPHACILLRTNYEFLEAPGDQQQEQQELNTSPSSQQILRICIDDVSNQLSEITIPPFKGANSYDSMFDKNFNEQGQLIYRLKSNKGSIIITTIELIAIPHAPVTGLLNSKHAQTQLQSSRLKTFSAAQKSIQIAAQLMQDDEKPVRSQSRLNELSRTIDSDKNFKGQGTARSMPEDKKDSIMISGGMQNRDELEGLSKVKELTAKIHQEYNLATKLKQMKGLQDYQQAVEYKIPLNELYELWSTCLHTSDCNFCAILLKIKDPKIRNLSDKSQKESDVKKNEQFLLQIWKRGGQLIFEKSLKHPVCNWNMTGNHFLFQQKPSIPQIYVVNLRENQAPQIHKFLLDPRVFVHQVNTYYDSNTGKLVVPPEDMEDDELENLMKGNESAFSREHFSFVTDTDADLRSPSEDEKRQDDLDKKKAEERFEKTPFCKRFSHDIINRAPDKMCDFVDGGFIVVAYRQIIYYFDIRKDIITDPEKLNVEAEIPAHLIRKIPVRKNKKVICFQELNTEQSCIVIEDTETRDVSFLAFKMVDDTSQNVELEKKMDDLKVDDLSQVEEETKSKMGGSRMLSTLSKNIQQIQNKEQLTNFLKMPYQIATETSKVLEVHKPMKMKLIGLSVKDTVPQHDQEQEVDQKKEEKNGFRVLLPDAQRVSEIVENTQDEKSKKMKHKLLKFRSTALLDENGMWSQVSLLLREDGSVEIYADFLYVGKIYDEKSPCIDIEQGDRNFFFRQVDRDFVKMTDNIQMIRRAFNRNIQGNNGDKKIINHVNFREKANNGGNQDTKKDDASSELLEQSNAKQNLDPDRYNANLIFMHPDELNQDVQQISRVEKSWKNRISKGYMLKETILDEWEEVLHERVAPFCKLYTAIENIGTFMIVSHRNMLSVFNMGEKEEVVENEDEKSTAWVDTVQVSEPNFHIRKLNIVKRKDAHVMKNEGFLKQTSILGLKRKITKIKSRIKKGKHGQAKNKKKDSMLPVEKFDICCLVGSNKLIYLQIDEHGKFRAESYYSNVGLQTRPKQTVKEFKDWRVLQLCNDITHDFGMILLLESTVKEDKHWFNQTKFQGKAQTKEVIETKHCQDEEGSDFISLKELECYIYKFTFSKLDEELDKHENTPKLQVLCVKKEKDYLLLEPYKCAKEMLLSRRSTIGLRVAWRKHFEVKKIMHGKKCEVSKSFPKTVKLIRVFAIANNGTSKVWPIHKYKDKMKNNQQMIKLLTDNGKNSKTYNADEKDTDVAKRKEPEKQIFQLNPDLFNDKLNKKVNLQQQEMNNNIAIEQQQKKDELNQAVNDQDDEEQEQDVLLDSFYLTNEEFKEDRGCYFRISKDQIRIFNPDKTLMFSLTGLKFESIIQVKQTYLYVAQNHNDETIVIQDTKKEKPISKQVNQREGLYVYSIKALLQGNVEPYLISSQGTGGGATLLHYNQTQGRLAFMEDFNTIVIVPLPQLNIINFIRMKNKQHYFMWREKRGFFTALNKKGMLHTWSIVTGALLYDEKTTIGTALESYKVYQSDESDITYTTNGYNLPKHSLTLLVTNKSVSEIAKTSSEKIEEDFAFKIKKPKLKGDTVKEILEKEITSLQGMSFETCSEIFEKVDGFRTDDSELVMKLHHFKVMELTTYEDNYPEMSNCRVLFEFDHPLIQKKNKNRDDQRVSTALGTKSATESNPVGFGADNEKKEGEEMNNLKSNNPNENEAEQADEQTNQRLYLSQDTKLLMEVIQNKFALVYKRTYKQTDVDENGVAIGDDDENSEETDMNKVGQLVRWKVLYKIKRWPSDLTKQTSVPFMFSPNFKFQIDYDSRRKQIMILDTKNQNLYMWLKKGMINTAWANSSIEDAIPLIFSRIWWVKDDEKDAQFHIVTQNNLDCIFRIIESEVESERDLELISVCKIDNQFTDNKKIDSPHYFHEPYPLKSIQVTERLIRMNQNYKRQMQHARNMRKFEKDDDGSEQIVKYMVEHVQKIDYTQPWSKLDTYFQIEMSFTWLDWLIIEEAINNQQFRMKDVSDQSKLQLAQNVLPNGQGILHMLAGNTSASMQHIIKMANNLFSFSSSKCDLNLYKVDEPVTLEIPFLNDYKLRSPLDICLDVKTHQNSKQLCPATTKLFCSPRKFIQSLQNKDKEKIEQGENMNDRTSSRNIQLADVILENIKEYSLMHSSQLILDALIVGTRLGLPNVSSYLDSRIEQNQHKRLNTSYPKMKVKFLKNECTVIDGEYGTISASIFGPMEEITKKIFKKKGAKQQTRIETIDIPELFQQCDRGRDFIEALTQCKDSTFFTHKSVQVLIDHHYYFWYKINLFAVVVPAFLQLILFWAWSNFILPIRMKTIYSQKEDSVINASEELPSIYIAGQSFNYGDLNYIFKELLFIVTLYLFCYDLTALAPSLWTFNTNNNAPSASLYFIFNLFLHLLMLNSLMNADDDQITQSSFWQLQSWVALAVWLRFVSSYLGEIKEFSWLVGLIKYSCTTTIYFLIVFVSLVTAFTDSFNALDQKLLISGDNYDWETEDEFHHLRRTEDLDITILANFNKWLKMWQISFRSSIGDFSEDDQLRYFSYIDWMVFFLMCFFLIILMLNLLISVITEAHENYLNAKIESIYLEKALQIQKNSHSFLWFIFKQEAVPLQMLNIVLQASNKQELNLLQNVNTTEDQIALILEQVESIADNIEAMQENAEDVGSQNNDLKSTKSRKSQRRVSSKSLQRVQEDWNDAEAINEPIYEEEDDPQDPFLDY